MPKQQLVLNRFEGGMNTEFDPRDISDNQFSLLEGFNIDSIGIIKMLGGVTSSNLSTLGTHLSQLEELQFYTGYGLFAFKSDYDHNVSITSGNDYLAASNGSIVNIHTTVSGPSSGWNELNSEFIDQAQANDIDIVTPFSLGAESGVGGVPLLNYYAPEGDLRVSDGDFTTQNNVPKWLGAIPKKKYGRGTTKEKLHPTVFAEADVGERWRVYDSGIEEGLDSEHLKMINLGSKTKGIMEGNSADDSSGDSGSANFVNSVSGNAVICDDSELDHGVPFDTDNSPIGLTCSLFADGETAIYGVVTDYDTDSSGDASLSVFTVMTDSDGTGGGSGTAQTIQQKIAASGTTTASDWSFQVGQQDGYLWNKTLHKQNLNRGVISADYGVTLLFEEGATGTGSWMPTTSTRYKFYHSTIFDGNQESLPALFTMYPTKQAAGTTTHANVNEMWFRDGTSEIGVDNDIGTPGLNVSIGCSILIRMRSDNYFGANATTPWNTKIANNDYPAGAQNDPGTEGKYNFLGGWDGSDQDSIFGNERVTGGRIYWATSEDGYVSLNLLIDYDLEKGGRPIGSSAGGPGVGGYTNWISYQFPVASNPILMPDWAAGEGLWYDPPLLETYESINGYAHDTKLDAKWKTSVVANGSVYIANILRKQKSGFGMPKFSNRSSTDPDTVVQFTLNTDEFEIVTVGTVVMDPRIKVGMRISTDTTSIPPGTYVKRITSATRLELSQKPISGGNATVTFLGNGWNYVSNLQDEHDIRFRDRIIKSPPGKFDTFPEENALELFNSDDGDEIVKLETFADRLLVFKRERLQIVNKQKGGHILEGSYELLGLDGNHPGQSCFVESGIAWLNRLGVYLYDGKTIHHLVDNKIKDTWDTFIVKIRNSFLSDPEDSAFTDPLIAYDAHAKHIIINEDGGGNNQNILIYSLKTKAWMYKPDSITFRENCTLTNNDATVTHVAQNASIVAGISVTGTDVAANNYIASITDDNTFELASTFTGSTVTQTLTFGNDDGYFSASKNKRFTIYRSTLLCDDGDDITSWNDTPQGGGGIGKNTIITKDIDFGSPGVRKKVYKVYVTYKGGAGLHCSYATDGSDGDTDFPYEAFPKKFKDGQNFANNELATPSGNDWQIAELKPSTSSEANNIYSFRLKFTAGAGGTSSAIEINDITIVYRVKPVK